MNNYLGFNTAETTLKDLSTSTVLVYSGILLVRK